VQQFTGPMMAKSLEDTAFYRFHRLLALNEVGGSPDARGLPVEGFHHVMQSRAKTFPHGLTATATHDTKRGEDARARLVALSELADEWGHAAGHWRSLNARLIVSAGALRIPSPAHEYMLYQALLGAWPLEGLDQSFVERVQAYAVKAAREGKQQTSWLAPDERYEAGLKDFIAGILDRTQSAEFIAAFDSLARRTALIGALNSLTQLALKATMPGVPDFYQGTELWDLSFVDPDNRRPVDFAARAADLASFADVDWQALASTWPDGRIKFALVRRLLTVRQQLATIFTEGFYHPLAVAGPNSDEILAFARTSGRRAVIVAVGRRFAQPTDDGRRWPSGDAWQATIRAEGFSSVRNALGAQVPLNAAELSVSALFDPLPVAILEGDWTAPRRGRTPKNASPRPAPAGA
jgi:(1->4)-alpha-D-glucan 1-alpha-D-glucosylmutase